MQPHIDVRIYFGNAVARRVEFSAANITRAV
jgi:hypothetical protein